MAIVRYTNGSASLPSTTPTKNVVTQLASNKNNNNWTYGGTRSGWANWPYGTYNPVLDWGTTVARPFTTADILNARYQSAYNNKDYNLADAYKVLNQENTSYNKVANQIADYYNALAQDVSKREQWLADAKYDVANKLFNDMADQKDYVWWLYWPNGSLTTAINTYYDDMGDYLASEAGREMAYADALWVQSWASLWMMRAQRNQAYNEAFQKSLQVMQAELEAKQTIAQNLITFMTNLRKEYWDTANTYIISQYERANDLLNTISESIAKTASAIQTSRFGWGGSSSSSNTNETRTWDDLNDLEKLNFLKDKWVLADNTNIIERDKDWNAIIHFTDGDKTWWSWGIANIWWWNAIINTLGTWANIWTWNNIK